MPKKAAGTAKKVARTSKKAPGTAKKVVRTAKKAARRPAAAAAPQRLEIQPLESLGKLRFGAERDAVKAVLGPAKSVEYDRYTKKHKELRGNLRATFVEGKLTEVTISNGLGVLYDGQDIFQTPGIVELLAADEPEYVEKGPYMNFPRLGIYLGGFGKRRAAEGKLVRVYGRDSVDYFKGMIEQ